jgi:hypothetical protein
LTEREIDVNGHINGRTHRHVVVRRPSAAATAERYKEALEEREEWRADMTAGYRGMSPQASTRHRVRREVHPRGTFAEGIARAEFGRFYWDVRRHGGAPRPSVI